MLKTVKYAAGTVRRARTQEVETMSFLTSNSQLLLEKSMGYLWTKQAAILDNIANAETPNYKAKVVTFEESLRSKLEARLSQGRYTTSGTYLLGEDGEAAAAAARTPGQMTAKSIRSTIEEAEPVVFEAQEQTRMDDNGVNTTDQMVELVRNAYQQQYVYQAINKHYSILRMAVRGQ